MDTEGASPTCKQTIMTDTMDECATQLKRRFLQFIISSSKSVMAQSLPINFKEETGIPSKIHATAQRQPQSSPSSQKAALTLCNAHGIVQDSIPPSLQDNF
uniref:Uncharacterized protein n=1 Tax=Sphaerodactylus townsendi TaxID=933632 RepID=A0ACB8G8J0_9SAUR